MIDRLTSALVDHDRSERELGAGGMPLDVLVLLTR